MKLYEILVPCQFNSGKPIRTKHHKEWDKFVRSISGGLTILKPARGQWVNAGRLYEERMIPVRIMCTEAQIRRIMDHTARHYRQLAVMAYTVSEQVIYKEYNDTPQ